MFGLVRTSGSLNLNFILETYMPRTPKLNIILFIQNSIFKKEFNLNYQRVFKIIKINMTFS